MSARLSPVALALPLAGAIASTACAADDEAGAGVASAGPNASWTFALTAYPTAVRGGDDFTSAIAAADRGPLHLEARYNYESVGARSAFVGWTFSGGQAVTWQLTPLVGGAWGTTRAFVPALEASVAWRALDAYIEAEYVHDSHARSASYTYAWTELGLRPVEWLRVGLAGQRTRAYGGERDFQRGPFAQVTVGIVTIGGYWFNPGAGDQVFVGSLGVKF